MEIKMKRYPAVLLLILLISSICLSSADCSQIKNKNRYVTEVKIINKANLPPERLADAIAAKALLSSQNSDKLLRQAAAITPKDPLYWYLLAENYNSLYRSLDFPESGASKLIKSTTERSRQLLEQSLAIDPNYLPALYAYAASKPTHNLKMQALGKIADLDTDNAKAYYMMAIEQYCALTKDRHITKESDSTAFDMTDSEWASVIDLIHKGNERPILHAVGGRLPSTRDISITTGGKRWPDAAVQSILKLSIWTYYSGTANAPVGTGMDMSSNAISRQIARQAAWQAKLMTERGTATDAIQMLEDIRGYAYKFSALEPNDMDAFLVGDAIRALAGEELSILFKQTGDKEQLNQLQEEDREWKNAVKKCASLLNKEQVTIKSIRISPTDYLQYNDHDTEEAGMLEILLLLGLK